VASYAKLCSAVSLASFLLACACWSNSHRLANEDVRGYINLALALGERDPASLDFYSGPPEWVAQTRMNPPNLHAIQRRASALAKRLRDQDREFEMRQLQAIAARAAILTGERSAFDEESLELFGVRAPHEQDSSRTILKELETLLPGKGSLPDRYAAFERMFLVPPDRLSAVVNRTIEASRDRTLRHLKLPAGENVRLEYVSNKPWGAYSRYEGHYQSTIQLNTDLTLTVDRAFRLLCHEAYPGHHVYDTLRDQKLVQQSGHLELMVRPTFSPEAFASEAMAMIATDVAFSAEERESFERRVLFPLAGLDSANADRYFRVEQLVDRLNPAQISIARSYLDGKTEFLRAAEALRTQALVLDAEETLKYVNRYRTYMLSYTYGSELLYGWLNDAKNRNEEDRWRGYEKLILTYPFPSFGQTRTR
jgi:hypothetical protein